jgi:glycosyltransferase involved in cell wall biosynthesis
VGARGPGVVLGRSRPSGGVRVLHVMTRYLRGGSEKRLHDMVRAMPEADHELVVGDESSPADAVRAVDLASVRVVPALVRPPSPADDARALVAIRKIVRDVAPDLVVTHQSKAGVLGRLSAAERRIPSIASLSMANFGPGYSPWQSATFRTIERSLHRATAAYAVVGRDLARRFERIGVPADKLRVVRSGMQLPSSDPSMPPPDVVRRRLGIALDRPLIVYVGSLEARKNVEDLLPLLRQIRTEPGPPPVLAIAGEGPLEGNLSQAIRAGGLSDDVRLLGFVEAPLELLAAADACILLSRAEGVPQVLVQAAALDTPFVAYDVDGVRELLAMGARGRVVAIGNLEGAARATTEVLGWDVGQGVPSIDLSGWSPASIQQGYRDLVRLVLPAVGADQSLRGI